MVHTDEIGFRRKDEWSVLGNKQWTAKHTADQRKMERREAAAGRRWSTRSLDPSMGNRVTRQSGVSQRWTSKHEGN